MTAYYPSQVGYPGTAVSHGQVMYPTATPGYGQYGMAGSYAPSGGVMYVPSYHSGLTHRRRSHIYNGYDYRLQPQVAPAAVAAPVMMQPSYVAGGVPGTHYGSPYHLTFSQRLRRFFGLAPSSGVRYKSDRGTWGFMGYSRRQRYIDPRTGGEVDRKGRPVYRI